MVQGESIRHQKGHLHRVSSGNASSLSASFFFIYLSCLTLSLPGVFPPTASPGLLVQPLVLRSLKTVRKEPTVAAMILGRSTPNLGVSSSVELLGGHPGGLLDLIRVRKTLPS